jgi:excinuclease ABC subunit A
LRPADCIRIRGARTHNLQSVDLDLPRNKLVVITGPSGSGKSSLAFHTIFAEGQRRYVESLSARRAPVPRPAAPSPTPT